MAKTKKAARAQAWKKIVRTEIKYLRAAIGQLMTKVPAHVLRGSHQLAVTWKESASQAAEDHFSNSEPGATLTLPELLKIRDRLAVILHNISTGKQELGA